MKELIKNKWFWVIFGVLLFIIAVLWTAKNVKIDGSQGGMLEGPSHADGGIKTEIKDVGGKLEVEGNEAIINKTSMAMTQQYICSGTPGGIASAVNELGGGVSFDSNGKCYKK